MTTKAKAKTSYKTGRPTKYTEALAAEICRRIADGASLRSVCEAEDMPDRETVRRWLREKGGFAASTTTAGPERFSCMGRSRARIRISCATTYPCQPCAFFGR